MAVYSHSKLGTFETCKLQYKFRYIDKIKVETDTIEKHLGSVVHDVLEKLYKDLLMGKMNSKDELLSFYETHWEKNWHDKIVIVKTEYDANDYWKRGQRSLADYYDAYHPFDQGKTLGLEMPVQFDLDPEGKYKIRGFIDRLVWAGEGIYEVHDYKTAAYPPTEESLKEDRQLALYQIDVQKKYSDAKEVKLIWHYLTFGKEFSSKRTQEELEDLKGRTIRLIDEVESTTDFPPEESGVCPWCDYQHLCPVRKHLVKVGSMSVEDYLKDDGIKIVNEYMEFSARRREIDKHLDILKDVVVQYAKREGYDVIRGSTHKLRVKEDKDWKFPGTGYQERNLRDGLEGIIKESGKESDVYRLDVHSLKRIVNGEEWPADLLEKVKKFGTQVLSNKIYPSKLKDRERSDE